jgi:hypothetical protein
MNYRLKPTMPQLAVFISLVGLLILLSGNALQPAAAQTTLPRFNLVNNAVLLEDRLRLTIDQPDQSGAAWLLEKQQVQQGFEATFDWQITKTRQRGADGFAFVIQNTNNVALGAGGSGIGYSGIANSIAVEFDTTQNPRKNLEVCVVTPMRTT